MRRIALLFLLAAVTLSAQVQHKDVEIVDIGKLDRTMTLHKAKVRKFKSPHEVKQQHNKEKVAKHDLKHSKRNIHAHTHKGWYGDGVRDERDFWYDEDDRFYDRPYSRPYRHPKRGWILAYKYDRAGFYDREGFYYGYFNRYGYFFEGEFYRYDRYYRYRDRVRGRGLFDRNYYKPARWRYYGFCR